ncbi:3,4-dihydroxy-2-butanone-4-phosphate synthase, partial [Cellulomonas bogoriensis]|uniref:3,4-dihydroxy-2-butanone-4-phosphate synthase n=1 Tax=Cellulomonas bogoriensis TaxID=301388 RepID=UPI0005509E21
MTIVLGSVEDALRELAAGRPVLVADSPDRENEADVVLAAQSATPEWVGWTIRHSSGYLCAPMPAVRADALELPLMVPLSQDPRRTAYTVTVDAADGVTTGISAEDRARTLRVLADPSAGPGEIIRPGHVLPLRAA